MNSLPQLSCLSVEEFLRLLRSDSLIGIERLPDAENVIPEALKKAASIIEELMDENIRLEDQVEELTNKLSDNSIDASSATNALDIIRDELLELHSRMGEVAESLVSVGDA